MPCEHAPVGSVCYQNGGVRHVQPWTTVKVVPLAQHYCDESMATVAQA